MSGAAPRPSRVQRCQTAVARQSYRALNGLLAAVRRLLWRGPRPAQAERICIYRIGNLGDMICAVPAMIAIRRAYPSARLTVVTSPGSRGMPGARELLEGAPWIDDLHVYYADEIATLRSRAALVQHLRDLQADVWIELPADLLTVGTALRNMAMAWGAGARWAAGWRIHTLRWAARAEAIQRVFPTETERLMALVETLGIPTVPVEFPLPIRDAQRRVVGERLREAGYEQHPLVALAPGAKRAPNRWPLDRFAAVGERLVRRGYRVIVIGGESDAAVCREVAARIGEGAVSWAGAATVLESCELLRRCRLLVGNDSGVQHLAAAMQTPCLSIFSHRDIPGKWSPYGPVHTVLQKWVACHTCFVEQCPYDNRCINLVEVVDVLAHVDRLLASGQVPSVPAAPPRP